ncbi:MAG: recombination protein RecR [Myxococcales bacterium]|nr:recombination protein RecR [Myxococcales bacterium]
MNLPVPLERLVASLSRLPGVGEKTATRLAFYILREKNNYAEELSAALLDAKSALRYCRRCHHLTDNDLCVVCVDTTRHSGPICIVESVPDLLAIERTGDFSGTYHVLHGVIAPLRGIGPDDLRLRSLIERLKTSAPPELIIATNVGVEGEATALYIKKVVQPLGIRVSRIATGIPMGGDLEYLDQITLSRALSGRRDF